MGKKVKSCKGFLLAYVDGKLTKEFPVERAIDSDRNILSTYLPNVHYFFKFGFRIIHFHAGRRSRIFSSGYY